MSRRQLGHTFADIISLENLLLAWREFSKGKRHRQDVQMFGWHLMDNLMRLNHDLTTKKYLHGTYQAFNICDPKPRSIHKASVRDRVLHHAVYRILYPFFDRKFIADSFSCREGKGTHKALDRFHCFSQKVSRNNTSTCWILKCDIRKFFASIDQNTLLGILSIHIQDEEILWLLERIVRSFYSTRLGRGLPLGNLTSQLLVNIYMNEFDQYVKHGLKVKYYIRYADDFVLLSNNKAWLIEQLPKMTRFLYQVLCLELHPNKVCIETLASGVDWLGWVHRFDHRVLRKGTKRRMFRRLEESARKETVQSYLGLLKHGNTQKLQAAIKNISA
jgi:retron-type reverse transcriptase